QPRLELLKKDPPQQFKFPNFNSPGPIPDRTGIQNCQMPDFAFVHDPAEMLGSVVNQFIKSAWPGGQRKLVST
ncbi:MAG: hypothetical protein ACKPJD_01265, partial [Planctomycetaceae bacterium]